MLSFLLTLVSETDRERISSLFHDYYHDLIRAAYYRLNRENCPNVEANAEDLVQETFLKIACHISKIPSDDEPNRQKSYIYAILSNLIVDFLKDQKRVEDIDDYADILQSEDDYIEKLRFCEQHGEAMKALKQLSEMQQIMFYYRYSCNMSLKEIAELMGLKPGTVDARLMRGLAKIRAILREKGEMP